VTERLAKKKRNSSKKDLTIREGDWAPQMIHIFSHSEPCTLEKEIVVVLARCGMYSSASDPESYILALTTEFWNLH